MSNHTRPTRIVLVGDEGENIRNMLCSLRHVHYTLCFVRDLHQLFLLSPEHEFDLLILEASHVDSLPLSAIDRTREIFPSLPIVLIVAEIDDVGSERLYRAGIWQVWSRSSLSPNLMQAALHETHEQHTVRMARERENMLEHALSVLRENLAEDYSLPEVRGTRPLREALPLKFLELTRTYSNLLEIALAPPGGSKRFSGHSVSHKLHFLASDLAMLNAGPADVLDVHRQAVASHPRLDAGENAGCRQLLIELLSDLAAQYKHATHSVV